MLILFLWTYYLQDNSASNLRHYQPQKEVRWLSFSESKWVAQDWIEQCLINTKPEAEHSSCNDKKGYDLQMG